MPDQRTATDFVQQTLDELLRLPLRPTGDAAKRRLELANLLAETANGNTDCRQALMEIARSSNGPIRDLAILMLGRIPNQDALDFLLREAAGSPDVEVRKAVLRSLVQDQGWNLELHLREDGKYDELAVGPICNPKAVRTLLAATSTERDPAVLSFLIGALESSLPDGVSAGPDADADRAAHPQGLQFAEETLAALRGVLDTARDTTVRIAVLNALGSSRSPVAGRILGNAARNAATPSERAEALSRLALFQGVPGVDVQGPILDALHDPEEHVLMAAMDASYAVGRDEDVYRTLVGIFKDSQKSPNLRRVAYENALGNLVDTTTRFGAPVDLDPGRVVQFIEESLGQSPDILRLTGESSRALSTIQSLSRIGKCKLTPAQEQLLQDLKLRVQNK